MFLLFFLYTVLKYSPTGKTGSPAPKLMSLVVLEVNTKGVLHS